ncbi:hypothetical protein ACQB60_31440 [Actinomycetota bacterium Odt1-20B]
MMDHPAAPRLLPWTASGGKPCYLLTDGAGYLARIADNIEAIQLGMGTELLGHVRDLLDDDQATIEQLRFVTGRLSEALGDALRVAESRGQRLPNPADTDFALDHGGDDDGPTLSAGAFG